MEMLIRRESPKKKSVGIFLWLSAVLLPLACGTNEYREPISKFQAAAAIVSDDARRVFTEINRLQRTLRIKQFVREGKTILKNDLAAVQPMTKDDLQARLDTLDRLNDYIGLLVSIANSDAPENIAKSAETLTSAVNNLVTAVNDLRSKGDENAAFRTKVNSAFGVTSVIVSEVLKAFMNKKIKEGLEKAILSGEQPVNELIEAVGDQLTVYHKFTLVTFDTEQTTIFELYNCEILKRVKKNKKQKNDVNSACDDHKTNSQLVESYKAQMITNEDLLETLRASDPNEALTKMKKAHSKIVALAKTGSSANFAEAVAAIEVFAAAAKRLGGAVEKLKNS